MQSRLFLSSIYKFISLHWISEYWAHYLFGFIILNVCKQFCFVVFSSSSSSKMCWSFESMKARISHIQLFSINTVESLSINKFDLIISVWSTLAHIFISFVFRSHEWQNSEQLARWINLISTEVVESDRDRENSQHWSWLKISLFRWCEFRLFTIK